MVTGLGFPSRLDAKRQDRASPWAEEQTFR
jgi:hypothetical protein